LQILNLLEARLNRFEQASQRGRDNIASEFWQFLSQSKKGWLVPIRTAAAPFIYSLFR
jgi:hypothetical protein